MYKEDIEIIKKYYNLFEILESEIRTLKNNIRAEKHILDGFMNKEEEIVQDTLYTLYESAKGFDEEEKFDKFRDGLTNVLHYMVDLWDKNHSNLNSFDSLKLLSDFFIQIINRLLKYNMYRLYRIMTIYQADNIIMTPNFMCLMDMVIEKHLDKNI